MVFFPEIGLFTCSTVDGDHGHKAGAMLSLAGSIVTGLAHHWVGQGFQGYSKGAIEFVDTQHRNCNAHHFYILLFAETRCGIFIDIGLGDAGLVGNDPVDCVDKSGVVCVVVQVFTLNGVG